MFSADRQLNEAAKKGYSMNVWENEFIQFNYDHPEKGMQIRRGYVDHVFTAKSGHVVAVLLTEHGYRAFREDRILKHTINLWDEGHDTLCNVHGLIAIA